MNNGTGDYGWIGLFYTPLPDERCEQPILECVEFADVYETSTQAPPDRLGRLINTTVEIVGAPQDGRVPVQFHNGPAGWVDQDAFFDGYDNCDPYLECVTVSGPGYTIYPDQGDVLNPGRPNTELCADARPVDLGRAELHDLAGYRWNTSVGRVPRHCFG